MVMRFLFAFFAVLQKTRRRKNENKSIDKKISRIDHLPVRSRMLIVLRADSAGC
jgi:hypothetical protein